jgi:hypothetical protein
MAKKKLLAYYKPPASNKGQILVEWASDQDTFLVREGAGVSEVWFCKWGRIECVTNNQWHKKATIERIMKK